MAKRKRLTPASITATDTGAESPSEAPLETKAGYPLGVAPPARTRAPIAQVAGEASAQAALTEVAEELQAARDTGRLVQMLALEAIESDHLLRDRMASNPDEMEVLKTSIKARGQQTAIEVVDLGQGRYGLISGWRRLQALKALYAETGEARFAQVQSLIKPLEGAEDSYVAMVEENEIREGLSFYERARLASEAARIGVYPTPARAVAGLFAHASAAKRSKISAFLRVHDRLKGILTFPTAIPEKLGLTVARALEEDPGFENRLRDALRRAPVSDAGAERGAIERALKGPGRPGRRKADPKAIKQQLAPGMTLEARQGRVVVSGKGVTAELAAELAAAMQDWLARR